jgi:hypothetical protein
LLIGVDDVRRSQGLPRLTDRCPHYVEADRARADDYYLAEATGAADRFVASGQEVRAAGTLKGTAMRRGSPTAWTRPARQPQQPGSRRSKRPSLLPEPFLVLPRCCLGAIRSPTTHGCATRRRTRVLRGACSARCTTRPEARTGRGALAHADCAHSPPAHRGVLFELPYLVRATDVGVAGRGRHAHLAPLATRQRVCCRAVDCAPALALQATSVSTFPPA